MKQGAIELQFNWIFILLVGALILVFFVAIVNQQQKVSSLKIAFQVREKMDAILAGSAAGPIERTERIEIPKLEITSDCDNFYLSGEAVALPITIRPVFAPELIRGDAILLWSQDWSVPFAVSNFLYVTSPEVRYIFVDTGAFARRTYSELPDTIFKELVPPEGLGNLTDKNNYKIRFIFFNAEPIAISQGIRTDPQDITAINIKGSTTLSGDIDFYKGRPFTKIGSTKYLGAASLYGAIFSENPETYNCLMSKGLKKLGLVADLYLKRSEAIQNDLDQQYASCKIYHAAVQSKLAEISSVSLYEFPQYPEENVKSSIAEIITINRQAIDSSCPTIY